MSQKFIKKLIKLKNNFMKIDIQKIKTLLFLVVFILSSFNIFSQTSSLISSCNEFVTGTNSNWPYVLVATTLADSAASQSAQTYTMNVINLPAGGANVRVYKTTANGSNFWGNSVALTLGSNSITVPAVNFDRAVKFQFSSGDVEFDFLTLNGVASYCVGTTPPPTSSLINTCGDFITGPSAWPYVLVATTLADSAASQSAQTYTMNITNLPAGGANVRVYKTTANGSNFFGNPIPLTICSNSITVPAVNFNRAVKFQFSSGDVEFDALTLNGDSSSCVGTTLPVTNLVTACDSFTWIDGNTYTSSNNTATHTLINSNGCDSVINLDLTINYPNSSTDVIYACDSFTWIDGNTYTSSNNTATHTLINTNGCDSVINLDLTINYPNSSTDVIYACDSFTWIDGNTYTSSNNTATHTLINTNGCDSVVTLNLTISSYSSVTDFANACDSFTWIDGNTYTSSNNTATYTLINSNGCDSIFTLDLTINYSNSSTDIINACDSFTWIDGNTYTSSNNTATHTLINSNGCDSVINLDLTINYSNYSTDVINSCDSFTWIDGNTYTSSNNTAMYTLINSNGCDSVINLDLTITNINTLVNIVNDSTLQSQSVDVGIIYQWLDCNNNFMPIPGENNSIFITQITGDYAVKLTLNDCSETSDCYSINSTTGSNILEVNHQIQIFPNPTTNNLTISLEGIDFIDIIILDIQGKVLSKQSYLYDQDQINLSNINTGTYFLKIITPKEIRKIPFNKY